jgi:hypothetical protein
MLSPQRFAIIRALFSDNPVAQAELRHQRHVITTSRSGRGWIILSVLMLAPAALAALILIFGGLLELSLEVDFLAGGSLVEWGVELSLVMLITMNFALYFVVTMVTFALSANSITREKQNRTWDTLLLTNLDARRIVWGKWWASLQSLWGDNLMVGFLRLGLAGWFIMEHAHRLEPGPFGLSPGLTYVPVLLLLALAYTAFEAAFTAALGVAAPLSGWPTSVTVAAALGARLTAVVVGSVVLLGVLRLIIHSSGFTFLPLALSGLVLLAVITMVTLWLAQIVAVRGEVSPPEHIARMGA